MAHGNSLYVSINEDGEFDGDSTLTNSNRLARGNIDVVDIDLDGDLDIVTGGYKGAYVHEMDGDSLVSSNRIIDCGVDSCSETNFFQMDFGDVNNDGYPDILLGAESNSGDIIRLFVNAGDGTHEHPTQALLDIMSIKEHFGEIKNLKVGIIGDILHSRVALSNIFGLIKLGAKVKVCGPPHLIQKGIEDLNVEVEYDVDNLIEWADVINVLRIQRERMGVGIIPSIREYRRFFGITSDRMKNHKKEIVVMHPGPINRGVEIDSSVVDSDQAIILNQVLNGVAVRMSVLYLLLGNNDLKS
jgi:hypothetical protein